MGPRLITRTTYEFAMDAYQIMLEAILAVVFVLLVVVVVLRIVFPPIKPIELSKDERQYIHRANEDQK